MGVSRRVLPPKRRPVPVTATTVLGNASKRLQDTSPGPWMQWRTSARHARAIRFIETYCRPPKGYGAGQPMRLAEFQRNWLEDVLAPGINSAAASMPRGNGKSSFLAAVGTWATFDPDEGGAPQVPIIATTVSQAIRSVYGVALEMVRGNPELSRRSLIYTAIGQSKVVVPFTGGEMFPVSSDVDGLQGLDPSLAVGDEIGFQPIESWDSLLLASGKRPRSLVVGIGTPGLDRNNALWHLRSRVKEGIALPGFHFTEFAADEGCSIHDRDQWRKANPALDAGYMNEAALETAVALSPEGHFRVFRLGQWCDGTDCWLGPDGGRIWDSLRDPWLFVSGAETWIGVDIALKRDTSAVVAVQRRPDGRWHAKARIWQPTGDAAVDVTDIMSHLRELDRDYRVLGISYDPRFFDVPAKVLEDEGLPMLEVPQSVERMTTAVGGAFEAIKRGEVSHDGEPPAFAAQVLNAQARMNERGFTLSKGKSRGHIDSAVALALALNLAVQPPIPAGYFEIY